MSMKTDTMLSDVISSLKIAGLRVESDALYEKCAIVCEKYSLSTKELAGSLEAFLVNINKSSLTLDVMGKFDNHVMQNSSKRKKIRFSEDSPVAPSFNPARRSITFGSPDSDGRSSQMDIDSSFPSQTSTSSQTPLAVKGLFSKRVDIGKVILSLNDSLEDRGAFEPSSYKPLGTRVRVYPASADDDEKVFDNLTDRYRYMYTSLEERARALDKQLFKIQKDMCKLAGIDEEKDLQPIGVPSQDVVWVCGRVCNEATEGRINKSSVLIEGSRRDSGGRRLKVELKDIEGYCLFPGQVILVQGTASSGRVIVAKRLIEGVPRPLTMTSPSKLLDYHHNSRLHMSSQPLHIMIAAGPFTTNENLSYEPLNDLLAHVLRTKPDLVILVGPFVDVSQPLLESGDVLLEVVDDDDNVVGSHAASFEMVFQEKIVRDGLKRFFNSEDVFGTIPTQFVLVPSLNDAHHEFVYPQPPFADRELVKCEYFEESIGTLNIPFSKDGDPKKRVHLMPNPCMFKMNEVVFGVTSNDSLFGLSSDETSLNIPGNMRLQRLATHLLQQQSFNPQFPPPPGSISQMDFRQASHWQMQASPDVLILPSKLASMARDINGTLAINPGTLVKGSSAGTYAEIHIHPTKEDDIRDALIAGKTAIPHQVPARSKVAIKKI